MRKYLIISYEFVGKDFRTYSSSFAFNSDVNFNDELADEIIEAANEHAEAVYTKEYTLRNVAIKGIFPIDIETEHNTTN